MDITFGIITNNNINNINIIIDSIEQLNIPNYEIIIIGCNCDLNRKNTLVISFNENIYPGWITKKKNLITENAKYDIIVYLHDYIIFHPNWYKGMIKYGNNFDVLINPILNLNGARFRDWILNINFLRGKYLINGNRQTPIINAPDEWIQQNENVIQKYNINEKLQTHFIDYDNDGKDLQNYIYISGSYFIAKKYVMEKFPLNENLLHGQGEDVDWIQNIRNIYKISFNKHSVNKLIKCK